MAAESLRFALDDLRQVNIATGAHAGQSLIYLGCPQTRPDYRDGNPDLDNLNAHAWAYAYRMSGSTRTSDRDFALALFNTSVSDGFVGAPKQFNQAFRDSGNLVGYLDPNVAGLRSCAASPADGGTSGGGDGGTGGRDAGAVGNDGGTGGNDGGGGSNDGGDGEVISEESGCGCGSVGSFSAAALALMCLGMLGRNRRR